MQTYYIHKCQNYHQSPNRYSESIYKYICKGAKYGILTEGLFGMTRGP